MRIRSTTRSSSLVLPKGGTAVVVGLVIGCLAGNVAFGEAEASESRAAAFAGAGETSTISLIRELSEWRARALEAEVLLARAGIRGSSDSVPGVAPGVAKVLGSLEAERMVILSIGRSGGALQGAMLTVGEGVVVKVVEPRESVAAALVDRSYKGKLANLEGLPVQLAVR